MLRSWQLAALILFFPLLFPPESSGQPAGYREWYDSTLADRVNIPRQFPDDFPVGIWFYSYNQVAMNEVWDYVSRIGGDYVIYSVEKGTYKFDRWGRYQTLINSAPTGKYVVPLTSYDGHHGLPSYIHQSQQAREAVFYPFDTSEMRGLGYLTNLLTVSPWYDNVFTNYLYDSLRVNPFSLYVHDFFRKQDYHYREAVYLPSSSGDTVASGIAFRHKSSQTERWDQTFNGTNWVTTDNPINSSELFDGVSYYGPDPEKPGEYKGDIWNAFRSPHYLTIKGHLFNGGEGADNDTMLILNIYYEVDKGKTYRDSASPYTLQTADTNLRFLYKSVAVTKAELKPVGNPPFNWDIYHEVAKKINFQREGMGGPADTGVTAKSIDLEVIYVGTEKMALHSVSVRDSITHMLWTDDTEGVDYRDAARREIDTLAMDFSTSTLKSGFLSVYGTDEPPPLAYNGYRGLKNNVIQNNPAYVFATGDTMTSEHGWAVPYIEWNGDASRSVVGNYIGRSFWNFGDQFGIKAGGVPIPDIPSAKQHDGGRFGVPHLFDFDSMSISGYAALLQGRIDTMELLWQHGRLGAAIPGQTFNYTEGKTHLWRMKTMYETAHLGRITGRRYTGYAGLQSFFKIASGAGGYDTLMDHRFERAEVRALLNAMVLGYGSYGLALYKFNVYPWHLFDDNDYLITEKVAESGFGGLTLRDTLYNFIDYPLQLRTSGSVDANGEFRHDTLGMIDDLYFGFRDTYKELKERLAWFKQIGSYTKRLHWRDAYSIHFQQDEPAAEYDGAGGTQGVLHRTIPSNEIIKGVKAWHPITGVVDSLNRTYVEIGLYDTMIDTTGGVRNRLNDTNWISVVNRRVFETGNYDSADIGYSSATKAILDTLSETRTIELTLKLVSPDTSNQYNRFVRVVEVVPDTTHLPLIGKRAGLDTVVSSVGSGIATVRLTLGAGRAALLRITYTQPDESMAPGDLSHSNQRKIVYDPKTDRYFSTYFRWDSALSDYHVFFRRSLPMQELGAILWEPIEWPVSGNMTGGQTRTQNTHPSITIRSYTNKATPRVSIVWTAHPNDTGFVGQREVLIRDIQYFTYTNSNGDTIEDMFVQPIKSVGYHYGLDPYQWGTPVISSASGDSGIGEYIAWSDSTVGIVARGRLMDTNFLNFPVWTPYDTISQFYQPSQGYGIGQYPSMPPFTHRQMKQQSAPIVWQQPDTNTYGIYIGIVYGRLNYIPPTAGPKLQFSFEINTMNSPYYISPFPFTNPYNGVPQGVLANHYIHPSIDQSQDGLGRVMEGVTWEWYRFFPVYENGIWVRDDYYSDVFFRSIFFDTAYNQSSLMGTWISREMYLANSSDYAFPVVSSQNQVMVPADSSEAPLFSIVFQRDDLTSLMHQVEAEWLMGATPTWQYQYWKTFNHGGYNPNGTASEGKLVNRYSVLYGLPPDSTLRTTRQYYARTRPDGYLADGREVGARLNDSVPIGFSARLYDVWFSDAEESRNLNLIAEAVPDSLTDLLALLKTESFSTGDSVAIGGTMALQFFHGDSATATGKSIDFLLELVDSATGVRAYLLDSTRLDVTTNPAEYRITDKVIEVLSGTYYVRLRLASSNLLSNFALDSTAMWTSGRTQGWIESLAGKRVRKLDGEAGNGLRISAQPNPTTGETEFRFSVSRKEHVSMTVYDAMGREVERMIEKELFEAGRYAVEFDGSTLKP
ncbi:MAG: hypothetical protein KDD67_17165, partial [Ignavibacteriae bacterium]|nr:hypothetical protein [Ignavibacteriota bacterium]